MAPEATTTDANLTLGCINPDYFCAGTITADMEAVESALDKLAGTLDISKQQAARGIVRLANNNMVNAIKLISVNRGHDPRDFTLIAFGGGGGMHACELAKELGIKKVVIPNMSGVFSAWGMLLSDLRRDYLQTQIVELTAPDAVQQLNDAFAALEEQAYLEYEAENIDRSRVRFMRYGRFRYQNQEHSTEIDLPNGPISDELMGEIGEHFQVNYEREYTYRLPAPVELVTYHLIAMAEVDKLQPHKLPVGNGDVESAIKGQRQVDFLEDGIHMATVYDGDALTTGMRFVGPAIIEEAEATVVIPPTMPCEVDEYGNYRITTA